MKKVLSFVATALALMVLTSIPVKTVQAEVNSQETKAIEELKTEYDLKSVDKAPDGVVPMKFDTAEEAESFIKKIQAQEANQPDVIDLGNTVVDQKDGQARPMTWGTERRKILLGFCYMNIEASIEYLWSGSMGQNYYNQCTSVNSFLTGVSYGNAWTQTSYSRNIVNGGRQLDVQVNGKFDYYILINTSMTQYAGASKSYSASWTNP